MYTHPHTNPQTHTHKVGFTHRGRKNLDDITRDGHAVTDSNGEVRNINLNHLIYCSVWLGGVRSEDWGHGGGDENQMDRKIGTANECTCD